MGSFIFVSFLVNFPIYAEYEHHEGGHHHAREKEDTYSPQENTTEENLGICPVMREKASKEYFYVYEGKTYYFCCPMCIEKFKEDPQKYISKIKEINLEAYQFGFSPERIVIKKDDIVKLSVTSRDVTHGVYIKEYGINAVVKKEEVTKIEFVVDKIGEFDILCSVYCGPGHNDMKAKLVVEE